LIVAQPHCSAKVVSIVGARPQFVKAAAVSPALRQVGLREVLIHTGQHYDWEMSTAFFRGLSISEPDISLQIGSAPHGAQTGRMLEAIEGVLVGEKPDVVVVFGDTNSTLAGALAATKLQIPVAHVEAGLRSFDRRMPEEVNRVLTDHVSSLLFAPTGTAAANLSAEGITHGVVRTGDVMYDVAVTMEPAIKAATAEVLRRWNLTRGEYAVLTVHRAENTDDVGRWNGIMTALERLGKAGMPIVWPAHPRTKELLRVRRPVGVTILDPQPYLETQCLVRSARVVLTDSGGLQKEAAFQGVPCVTLRETTEWVELLDAGVNVLSGVDPDRIVASAAAAQWPEAGLPPDLYGDGRTSQQVAVSVAAFLGRLGQCTASPDSQAAVSGLSEA
jgi:UDP-GlcNAc3NAcA epimerase